MKKEIITSSFEETQKLGFDFAQKLTSGGVIALHGNLGAGKTTFVQGFAKGLGIEKHIISPTFIIMRTYELQVKSQKSKVTLRSDASKNTGQKLKMFYHVDLYRIESEQDVEGLGLFELINDLENVVMIEWPDKIEHLLPEKRIDIYFEYLEDDKRRIVIND